MPEDSPLLDLSESECQNWPLLEAARKNCAGSLSYSIFSWLALVEHAAISDAPYIRDCPAFDPIENNVDAPNASDATVILISGESDVFWSVANSRLTEDDPPVDIFQTYDSTSPAFLGKNHSVSEFALKYLCLYNEHSLTNREWFSANGTEEDIRLVQEWFDYSLVFDSQDGLFERFALLESNDIVAIVNGKRLEVSIFCEPAALDLPEFLRSEMEHHVNLRQKYKTT